MKRVLFSILSAVTLSSSLCAVQVIPSNPNYNSGGEIGRKFGEGFSKGLEQGLRERQQKNAQEKANRILNEILADYDPSRHSDYILKIMKSDLPNDMKKFAINTLNEQHKLYQKEKGGIWSWFKK